MCRELCVLNVIQRTLYFSSIWKDCLDVPSHCPPDNPFLKSLGGENNRCIYVFSLVPLLASACGSSIPCSSSSTASHPDACALVQAVLHPNLLLPPSEPAPTHLIYCDLATCKTIQAPSPPSLSTFDEGTFFPLVCFLQYPRQIFTALMCTCIEIICSLFL